MNYPTLINDVRTAAIDYEPNVEAAADAYAEALTRPKVSLIVGVFQALRSVADELDDAGRVVLCGAAHLINSHNFSQLRPEALAILQTVPQTLPEVPADDPEQSP